MKSLKIISQTGNEIFTTALSLMMKENLGDKVQILALSGDLNIDNLRDTLIICIWTKHMHELIMAAIQNFRQAEPCFPFVIIDMEKMNQHEIREVAKLGSVAIVSSKASKNDLLVCINKLENEQVVLCPQMQDRIIHNLLEKYDNRDSKGSKEFSKTEQAIIETAKKGYSMKEAAEELNLSKNTIAAYRSKIMKKADVKSMAQLISILSEK